MAEYLIQDTTLDDIADAINAKTGGSSAMTPAQMVTAIGTIAGGGVSKVSSITLTAELNSYNVLQAMGAKCYYQNSIISLYVIGNTAATGGSSYTNNNYTMIHHGTTVLKSGTRYSFLDQLNSKVAPSNIYIGVSSNASRYELQDAFINADASFSFRNITAGVLTPIGATCILIETPLLDSTGNFDTTLFSA